MAAELGKERWAHVDWLYRALGAAASEASCRYFAAHDRRGLEHREAYLREAIAWQKLALREASNAPHRPQRLSKCPVCGYYAFNGYECFDCGYRTH